MNRGRRGAPRPLLLAAALMSSPAIAAQPATANLAPQMACFADPLQGRALYLRGTFNSWGAAESQRFTWLCNRWELVTAIKAGEHSFKVGDEAWNPDADFGAAPGALSLVRKGAEIKRRFANFSGGVHRFMLTMTDPAASPQLEVEACPVPPPLGDTVLFLRGSMNNWAALDDYAFQYSCDAYYLNIKAHGRHEFKIADAGWKATSSFSQGGANFEQVFSGEHTLRLVLEGGAPKLTVGAKTFADPRAVAVKDPVALSLRFDSRNTAHKQPFGAVTAGSTVHFAVTAAAGVDRLTLVVEKRRLEGNQEVLAYQEVARVPMVRSGAVWQASHRFGDVSIYGYWFEAHIGERAFALHNNADTVFWTREKGSGGHASVAELMAGRSADEAAKNTAGKAAGKAAETAPQKAPVKAPNTSHVRRFRQTVYAPDFKVPDWAADAVYYYVFPDRFRNGDKRNDPQPGRARYHQHSVELHAKWTEKPFRPGSGDGSDAFYNNDFFGGDLQGLISKLDYIKDLGANTIYMTPVFKAASNHKYDTADYRQIDPAFGSNADFERLCKEAAQRGIRVIPDASLNHTGSDSIYFNRFRNYPTGGAFDGGRINVKSPYADWYTFATAQRDPDKQYTGWVDVRDLPELNKASPSFRNFAYRDKDSVMKLWLDRGAAGWRMDVVPWVPDDFWREWRAAIKAHRPDALTVAETWFDASKYFLGDMFDSTMNYIFRNAVLDYAAGGNAAELYRQIELTREAYPPQAFHALMNLLSTHDQARALHHFGWSEEHGHLQDAPAAALAKQRLKLALLFQMTFPGAPSVYYGDEVGVTGGDDPHNRATYPWADEGGKPDLALLAEFKRLIQLRNQNAVLRRGSLSAPLLADQNVIVLVRRLGEQWAITATNNAGSSRRVTVALPEGMAPGLLEDPLGDTPVQAQASGISFEVPAHYGRVLLRR